MPALIFFLVLPFIRRHLGSKIRPRIRQRLLSNLCLPSALLFINSRLRPHVLVQVKRPRIGLRQRLRLWRHRVGGHLENLPLELRRRVLVMMRHGWFTWKITRGGLFLLQKFSPRRSPGLLLYVSYHSCVPIAAPWPSYVDSSCRSGGCGRSPPQKARTQQAWPLESVYIPVKSTLSPCSKIQPRRYPPKQGLASSSQSTRACSWFDVYKLASDAAKGKRHISHSPPPKAGRVSHARCAIQAAWELHMAWRVNKTKHLVLLGDIHMPRPPSRRRKAFEPTSRGCLELCRH